MKGVFLPVTMALAGLFLSGCAQIFGVQTQYAKIIPLEDTNQALILPGDKRVITVRQGPEGKPVSCAEPAPDIALSTLSEAAGNLAASADTVGGLAKPDVSAETSSKLATTAAELSGRNSTVLLARDFLFRLCELSANYKPGTAEYKAVADEFGQVLTVVKDLASAAKSAAQASDKAAAADLLSMQVKAGPYVGSLETKIDVIITKVSKDGKINLTELQKLVAKVPADILDDSGKARILAQTTATDLRTELSLLGIDVVTPMFSAAIA